MKQALHGVLHAVKLHIDRRPMAAIGVGLILLALIRLPFSLAAVADKAPPEGYGTYAGSLTAIEEKEKTFQLTLQTEENGKILVFAEKDLRAAAADGEAALSALPIGCALSVEGRFRLYRSPTNPGQFDQKTYYAVKGISGSLYADKFSVTKETKTFPGNLLHRLRTHVGSVLDEIYGTDAGLLRAMILGDKTGLSPETKKLFQKNGIAHVLAISGLHISLILHTLYRVLSALFFRISWKKAKPAAGLLSGLLMIFYIAFVGAPASAIRAGLFFAFSVGADVSGRGRDNATVWLLSFGIMVTGNPRYLRDAGFWLSFMAILAIFFVNERKRMRALLGRIRQRDLAEKGLPQGMAAARLLPLRRLSRRLPFALREAGEALTNELKTAWVLQLFMLPLAARFFYTYPLYGIIINLLVVPGMSILMTSALLGLGGGLILPALGRFLGLGARGVLNLYELLCRLFSALPFSSVCVGKPSFLQLLFSYGLLLLAYLAVRAVEQRPERTRQRRLKKRAWGRELSLVLMICAVALLLPSSHQDLEITVQDVGQGEAIFFETPEKTRFLVDAGSSSESSVGAYRVVPFLQSKGIDRLDYVFLTHMDADHINAVEEMLAGEEVRIAHLVMSPASYGSEKGREMAEKAKRAGTAVALMAAGDALSAGGLSLTCLYPSAEKTEGNESSLTLLLRYGDFEMLLTGDLEKTGEAALTAYLEKEAIEADVLKVGHHGSANATSAALLAALSARVGIISVGEDNSYGHPSEEVLSRLEDAGMRTYRTDVHGAVTVRTDGESFSVETYVP